MLATAVRVEKYQNSWRVRVIHRWSGQDRGAATGTPRNKWLTHRVLREVSTTYESKLIVYCRRLINALAEADEAPLDA